MSGGANLENDTEEDTRKRATEDAKKRGGRKAKARSDRSCECRVMDMETWKWPGAKQSEFIE